MNRPKDIIWTFGIYVALIYAAEITFGNPYFGLYLWRFDTIPAWMWSIPIHVVGFWWIVRSAGKYPDKPIIATIVSLLFFFEGEFVNLAFAKVFSYRLVFGSQLPAFGLVIISYFVLCWLMIRMLTGSRAPA